VLSKIGVCLFRVPFKAHAVIIGSQLSRPPDAAVRWQCVLGMPVGVIQLRA
jgi:hypothetical protein